jgi:hypothetical protein
LHWFPQGLKKKENEDDANALDALDATFRELSSKGEFRTGGERSSAPAVREKPDDYDKCVPVCRPCVVAPTSAQQEHGIVCINVSAQCTNTPQQTAVSTLTLPY